MASPWIYRPWLDLVAGCGAWSAPLLLLVYVLAVPEARAWSVAFYVLALVFNYPHFMATIYRAYGTRADFSKYRVVTMHLTGFLVLTALVAHASFPLVPWIFTVYLTWSPWHYTGQNYGLLMMFRAAQRCHAHGGRATSPVPGVRRLVRHAVPDVPFRPFERPRRDLAGASPIGRRGSVRRCSALPSWGSLGLRSSVWSDRRVYERW